jgi:hypothetical protein
VLAILAPTPGPSFASVLGTRGISLTPEAVFRDVYARYVAMDLSGRAAGCRPEQVELLNRRIEFQACTPPLEVVERLRSLLPPDGVLLLNPLTAFLGSGLLPARLAAPLHVNPWDWRPHFPRFRPVIQRALDEYQGMPFFAAAESPERRYLDARELGATHVVADPMSREAVLRAVSSRPDLFELLMDQAGWLLIGVRQTTERPLRPEAPR